jgi:hypothetical protein
MKYRIFAITLLLAAMPLVVQAATVRPLQGSVLLTRPGKTAHYLWDATPYIAQLAQDSLHGDAATRAIEATAVAALAAQAQRETGDTMQLLVVDTPVSATSYGNTALANSQSLYRVTASREELRKYGAQWAQTLSEGHTQTQIKLEKLGDLPATQ